MHFKTYVSSIIGNLLDHYDSALFGLLAPFLAPLFFANQDPVTALILTYGMLPLGILTRPLGSLFFGWLGDTFGPKKALSYSLLGMAIVTISMGSLPTYQEIGGLAPSLLALGKAIQSFCAAGETAGGAIVFLEDSPSSKKPLLSSLYDLSSLGGIMIASLLVTLFHPHWRLLFWLGGITALAGLLLRVGQTSHLKNKPISCLFIPKQALFSIIIASGFSHVIYSFAFTIMTGFVPLITPFSKTDLMQINTVLLLVDMMLLPCFGYLANKWGKEKIMLFGALFSAITAIPLFLLLDNASFITVIGIRLLFVTSGVAFAAPYYAWAIEQVPTHTRYTVLALGSALGSQLIGAPACMVSLWLYKVSHLTFAPAIYLAFISSLTVILLLKKRKEHANILSPLDSSSHGGGGRPHIS